MGSSRGTHTSFLIMKRRDLCICPGNSWVTRSPQSSKAPGSSGSASTATTTRPPTPPPSEHASTPTTNGYPAMDSPAPARFPKPGMIPSDSILSQWPHMGVRPLSTDAPSLQRQVHRTETDRVLLRHRPVGATRRHHGPTDPRRRRVGLRRARRHGQGHLRPVRCWS